METDNCCRQGRTCVEDEGDHARPEVVPGCCERPKMPFVQRISLFAFLVNCFDIRFEIPYFSTTRVIRWLTSAFAFVQVSKSVNYSCLKVVITMREKLEAACVFNSFLG